MKTKASIMFEFVDVTAKKDSEFNIKDKQEFVNINELKEDITEIKYGTLERNQFALDGSRELMSEKLDNVGWWSKEMSDENGNFLAPLVMEINFTTTHSSMGITLIFSELNDYCNKLNIKYYDESNTLISDKDFMPDNYYYSCIDSAENYKKIIITFYSTNNPYRYLKLYKILYGAQKVFEGENLINANILEELDLLSSEISINTLDFTAYSAEDEFNIINPKGLYTLLQERQKLKVVEKKLKENKELNMGSFYLESWTSEKNKIMKFKAIDLIGLIDKTTFYGGIYENVPFASIIKEIMTSAGLTEEDYEIDDELKNINMYGYIPVCSHREALQQAVFPICAVIDCSRSEKINIYKIKNNVEPKTIDEKTNIFQGTRELKQMDLVTAVSMTLHKYEKYDVSEEINLENMEEICSYTLNDYGIHILTFDEPAFKIVPALDISTNQNSNVTIDYNIMQEYNCNSAKINFDIDIVGEQIALAMAKEAWIQYWDGNESSLDGCFFTVANKESTYNYFITVHDSATTRTMEGFYVNIENGNVRARSEETEYTVTPNLKVVIYGYKYLHSTTQYVANAKNINSNKGDNVLKIDSAYLLNTDNMQMVAEHILNYYNGSYEDKFELILQDEGVSDYIKVGTNFGQTLKGNVTKLDIDLTGGFLANVTAINKVDGG